MMLKGIGRVKIIFPFSNVLTSIALFDLFFKKKNKKELIQQSY